MTKRLLTMVLSIACLIALAGCGALAAIGDQTPTPGDETASPTPDPQAVPEWVQDLIVDFEQDDVTNPPLSITEYRYDGETVYFVPQRCCDIYSDLYDAEGNLIAHPDGGITGAGDGRAPDFFEEAELVRVIWEDPRGMEGREIVEAPIVEVDIMPAPLGDGYALRVVSALPNGCHVFLGWEIADEELVTDKALAIAVRNSYPTAEDTVCTDIYRTVESIIPLPYDFVDGETYAITVNETEMTFTAGDSNEHDADAQAALDAARALWEAAGLSSYTARFRWNCFCIMESVAPVTLTVEDGILVAAVYAEDADFEGATNKEDYMTVEGLFDLLQEAIDQGADRIDVQYHAELGYPTEAFIDYSEMMADEERGFTLEVHPAS